MMFDFLQTFGKALLDTYGRLIELSKKGQAVYCLSYRKGIIFLIQISGACSKLCIKSVMNLFEHFLEDGVHCSWRDKRL